MRGYATSIAKYSNALEDAERALGRITDLDKALRLADVAEIPDKVNQLIQSVKEWKDRAQPIKAYYENYSKGAHLVTDLALDLQNEYGKLDDSRKLFKMLQEEFAEVDEIAALVAERLDALEAAESTRRHIEKQVKGLRKVVYEKHFHPDLSSRVDQLIQAVKGWRDLAQPIKAYCGVNRSVAKLVLKLAVNLRNKGKLHSYRHSSRCCRIYSEKSPKLTLFLPKRQKHKTKLKRSMHTETLGSAHAGDGCDRSF